MVSMSNERSGYVVFCLSTLTRNFRYEKLSCLLDGWCWFWDARTFAIVSSNCSVVSRILGVIHFRFTKFLLVNHPMFCSWITTNDYISHGAGCLPLIATYHKICIPRLLQCRCEFHVFLFIYFHAAFLGLHLYRYWLSILQICTYSLHKHEHCWYWMQNILELNRRSIEHRMVYFNNRFFGPTCLCWIWCGDHLLSTYT